MGCFVSQFQSFPGYGGTMAKLAALIVLLIAVAAAASVSAYRESSCDMEMEQMMPMRSCMMWMQGQMRRGGAATRYGGEDLEECCREVKEFSPECQCEAMEGMMMDMQKYGRMEMVERMVRSLPRMCGVSQCQFRREFA